jgi:hypothetical protein
MVDRPPPRDRQPATKPYKLPNGSMTRIPMGRERPHPRNLNAKERALLYPGKKFPKLLAEEKAANDGTTTKLPKERPAVKKTAGKNPALTDRERTRLQAVRRRLNKNARNYKPGQPGITKGNRKEIISNTRQMLKSTTAKERGVENKKGLTLNEKNRLNTAWYTGSRPQMKALRQKLTSTTAAERVDARNPTRQKALARRANRR